MYILSHGCVCRIVNGNYSIPVKDGKYECLHELVRGMLTVDPRDRFTVSDVLERLAAVAETKGFNMKVPLTIKQAAVDCTTPGERSACTKMAAGAAVVNYALNFGRSVMGKRM